jgi:hypothetical protein
LVNKGVQNLSNAAKKTLQKVRTFFGGKDRSVEQKTATQSPLTMTKASRDTRQATLESKQLKASDKDLTNKEVKGTTSLPDHPDDDGDESSEYHDEEYFKTTEYKQQLLERQKSESGGKISQPTPSDQINQLTAATQPLQDRKAAEPLAAHRKEVLENKEPDDDDFVDLLTEEEFNAIPYEPSDDELEFFEFEDAGSPVSPAQAAAANTVQAAKAEPAFTFTPPEDRISTVKAGAHVLEWIKNDGQLIGKDTDLAAGIQKLMDDSVVKAAGAMGKAAVKLADAIGLNFNYVKEQVYDATGVDIQKAVTEKTLSEAEKDFDTLVRKFQTNDYKTPKWLLEPINYRVVELIAQAVKKPDTIDAAYATLAELYLKETQRNPHADHSADIGRIMGKIKNAGIKENLQTALIDAVFLGAQKTIEDYKLAEFGFSEPKQSLVPALETMRKLSELLPPGYKGLMLEGLQSKKGLSVPLSNNSPVELNPTKQLGKSASAYCKTLGDPSTQDSIDAFYGKLDALKNTCKQVGLPVEDVAKNCENQLLIALTNSLFNQYGKDDATNSNGSNRNEKIEAAIAAVRQHSPNGADEIKKTFDEIKARFDKQP